MKDLRKSTRLLQQIPDNLDRRIYLVASSCAVSCQLKKRLSKIKGKKFEQQFVVPSTVVQISSWGRGIRSSDLYLDHTCFDNYYSLCEEDKIFLNSMYYRELTRYVVPAVRKTKNPIQRLLDSIKQIFKR